MMGRFKPQHLYFLLGALVCAISSVSADPLDCIKKITGLTFYTKSDTQFPSVTQPFNQRIKPTPTIVTIPAAVTQIQSIVNCARDNKVTISPISGGHSYGAYGLSGNIVVNMSSMAKITYNPHDHTVNVQTGTRLGNLAKTIYEDGKRALPHGSCPFVGSGGHTIYGGFGYLGRIGGLLIDTVIGAEVVLADGTLVTLPQSSPKAHQDPFASCHAEQVGFMAPSYSPEDYANLFTAIRGGGPSFGFVVSWTYQTLPAPETTVMYNISFEKPLTVAQATNVYTEWQLFIQNKPDELAAAVVFTAAPKGQVRLILVGNYYGTYNKALSILAPFIETLPKELNLKFTIEALGWLEGLAAFAGGQPLNTTGILDTPDTFYTKSLITTSADSRDKVVAFITYLANEGNITTTAWFVQVDLYGGRIPQVGKGTSFDHRSAFLVYQFYASSPNYKPPFPPGGIDFVNGIVKTLDSSSPPPSFPNYIDPELAKDGLWKKAYWPKSATLLEKVKKTFDPTNVFKFTIGF